MFTKSIVIIVLVPLSGLISVLAFSSCQEKSQANKIKVDFSNREKVHSVVKNSKLPLTAAVSAMTSPRENFSFYSKIFDYISKRIGRQIVFKQRKTYREINELLARRELDFAFICSGAYVEAKKDFDAQILAVPQIEGKTVYYAYIIVHADSGLTNFEDIKGHSFAFTDPLSNSGHIYPAYLVKTLNQTEDQFFSNVVYTYAHDYSIQAVASRIVDAASVDSLIFDHINKTHPEKTANLRIIKKSMPFGMPPVVVHPELDAELKATLQSILLNMGKDDDGRKTLSYLGIDCFVLSDNAGYDFIRSMAAMLSKANR